MSKLFVYFEIRDPCIEAKCALKCKFINFDVPIFRSDTSKEVVHNQFQVVQDNGGYF